MFRKKVKSQAPEDSDLSVRVSELERRMTLMAREQTNASTFIVGKGAKPTASASVVDLVREYLGLAPDAPSANEVPLPPIKRSGEK